MNVGRAHPPGDVLLKPDQTAMVSDIAFRYLLSPCDRLSGSSLAWRYAMCDQEPDGLIGSRPCWFVPDTPSERDQMSKEQKSNREKKKPKKDKGAKPASGGTAYAQAKAAARK
jgi:hypothetical protein